MPESVELYEGLTCVTMDGDQSMHALFGGFHFLFVFGDILTQNHFCIPVIGLIINYPTLAHKCWSILKYFNIQYRWLYRQMTYPLIVMNMYE